MSSTMCIAPIVAAIKKCEDILGPDRVWQAQNEGQAYFLRHFYPHRHNLSLYTEKELASWVSWFANELNEVLVQRNLPPHFQEFPPGNFGFLSILDVVVHWLQKGSVTKVHHGGQEYPAVLIGSDDVFTAYSVNGHEHPVVCVHTETGDEVFMTKSDRPYHGFELAQKVDRLSVAESMFMEADSVTFPMIDYDSQKSSPVDVSWLVGMSTTTAEGQGASVAEINQQTLYKKNEVGAHVKSAVWGRVAITSVRMPSPRIVIDEPYLEWHVRPGAPFPTFQAYWTPEDWKNPENLEL